MRQSSKPIFKQVEIKFSEPVVETLIEKMEKFLNMYFSKKKYTVKIKNIEAPKPLTNRKTNTVKYRKIVILGNAFSSLSKEEALKLVNDFREKLISRYTSIQNIVTVKGRFFYVQRTKHLLGLNIHNGKISFSRKSYEHLRVVSMLMGRQKLLKEYTEKIKEAKRIRSASYDRSRGFRSAEIYNLNTFNNIPALEVFLGNVCMLFSSAEKEQHKFFRNLVDNPLDTLSYNGLLSHIRNVDINKYEKLISIEKNAYNKCKEQLEHVLTIALEKDFKLGFERTVTLESLFKSTK